MATFRSHALSASREFFISGSPRRTGPSAHLQTWAGRLILWPARALYIGYAADTALHAHHAIQVCMSLDAAFKLRVGPKVRWREHDLAVIEPDRMHQLDGGGGRLVLLYLDPESDEGRALMTAIPRDGFRAAVDETFGSLRAQFFHCADHAHDAADSADVISALLRIIVPSDNSPRAIDSRVGRFLARLRRSPELTVSAAVAAQSVGLSSHRFQHVFRNSTGIPFRRYLLWLRLLTAVERVASGCSLTEAAYAAGFSDSAHLSRTFRRMFGLTPSSFAKDSEFIQARNPPLG